MITRWDVTPKFLAGNRGVDHKVLGAGSRVSAAPGFQCDPHKVGHREEERRKRRVEG